MIEKLKYFYQISRPSNVLISFLSIWIGALVAGGLYPLVHVVLAAISASLITIGANVINDYFDIDIDRINKPNRPLPTGRLTRRDALVYFSITYLLAWLLAVWINFWMFMIAFIFSIILVFYSQSLKRRILIGNFTVSFTTGMAFIYAGLAIDRISGAVFPALFAFFFHFGREVIKDLQDVEGDRALGARTFAIRYGTEKALVFSAFLFILLIVLTIIPYILDIYGFWYLLIVLIGVHPVLIFVIIRSWQSPTPLMLGKMCNLLKLDMLVGLLAIYLG